MVSIRNNRPASMTLNFVGGSGQIELLPGITLGVSDQDWHHAQKHPEVRAWLEMGVLEPLAATPAVSELAVEEEEHSATFLVADDAASGQPMPVAASKTSEPVDDPAKTVLTPSPAIPKALPLFNHGTIADLCQLPTVGERTAKKILDRRPTYGYPSLDAVKLANADLTRVDWDAIAAWDELWEPT